MEWNGPGAHELRTAGGHLGLTVFGVLSEEVGPPELRRMFDEAVQERADAAVMSAGRSFWPIVS